MNKTLLVLGAGVDQIPGINKAKEIGCYVVSLDGNPNALGKNISDEFYEVNIKDYNSIKEFLKTYNKNKIDGVIAYGVDIPTIIAKTAELLGVNFTVSIESAIISEDKYESKVFMDINSIPIPKYLLVENIDTINGFIKEVGFPIIIKPVDNSASRGITFVKDIDQIQKAYEYALSFSKNKKVIIEQCLTGNQISSESIVVNGEIYHLGFLDRNYDKNEMFSPNIIEDGGDMPSEYMNKEHIDNLTKYYKIISKKLDIKNGVIKGDLIIYENKLYIIEFALRLSGGNFSTICIPNSSHYDIIKLVTLIHLNEPINKEDLKQKNKDEYVSMRYKFIEECGSIGDKRVKEIQNNNEVSSNILYSNLHYSKDSILPEKTTDHSKRLGFAISKAKTRNEAIESVSKFLNNLEYIVE